MRHIAFAACTAVPQSVVWSQPVNVIEFYDAAQDHYFISSLLPDINALDSGHFPGWVRTGLSFGAYASAFGSASPVCRFYIPPVDGDSHFYSASPAECAAVQAKFPAFVLESSNVMYIDLPDPNTGACPVGDTPVYRVWDNRADTNHRYTTSPVIRAQMVAKGWVAEGYGPNLVIMCAPPGPKIGRYRLNARGVWAIFDRRGWPTGYYSGDVLHLFNEFDAELQNLLNVNFPGTQASPTVGAEVALQMDRMGGMGVNAITFELRSSDPTYIPGPFVPPVCNMGPSLGVQWPQPTAMELNNLVDFLNLAQSKGVRVHLTLDNTHMEDQPNSAIWLGAILNTIKNHPALDVVLFGGDKHILTFNGGTTCGIPAEPALWLGFTGYAAQYVQWAIGFAMSLGIPARQLSAEAILGNYFVDRVLSPPIAVLKQIFDALGIPDNQRTYALSFFEHRKCYNYNQINLPCGPDEDPHTWADETLQQVFATVGQGNGARLIAVEMGDSTPITSAWPPQYAMESLTSLLEKYGVEGGDYWIWSETDSTTEADPTMPGVPVKLRGLNFVYNPVQKEILDAYGFHLTAIANGSFETGGTTADNWTAGGVGTVTRFNLAAEPGQPVVPSRGDYALRLTTGPGASDTVSATSDPIQASPNTAYTTTANLRFQWSGDPNVGTPNPSRPQVYISVHYLIAAGMPSAVRALDTFRFFQEDAPTGFGTFPLVYTTPADANLVQLEFGAARNGLTQAITLDADNVR